MINPRARDRMFKRAVGLLIIASVLVLTLFLRTYQQTAAPFKDIFHLQTISSRADGMAINAPVSIAGIKFGWVQSIQLTDDNRVRLTLELDGKIADKLHADARANIIRPLIGSTSIDLETGSPDQPLLKDGAIISGYSTADINDVIASLPPKLDKLDTTLTNLSAVSADLQKISHAATNGSSSVETTLSNLQTTSRQASQAVGKLSTSLDETQLVMRKLGQAADKTNTLLDDVHTGTVHVGPLAEKLERTMDDVLVLSRELRGIAPKLPQTLSGTNDAIDDAGSVLHSAKNNILLRGNLPEPGNAPTLPAPR